MYRKVKSYATETYVVSVALVALGTGLLLLKLGYSFGNPWMVAALAVVAAVAERGGVKLNWASGSTTEQSISLLPALFAAVLFGPLAAGVVGAASMLGDPELMANRNSPRAPRLKWATYTSTRFIGGVVTGFVALAAAAAVPTSFGAIVLATLAAALTGAVVDLGFAMLTAKIRGHRALDVARTFAPLVYVSAPVYAPIVAILVLAYDAVSPWTAPLFFAPALAAQRLFLLYQHERRLALDLSSANAQLEKVNLSFASALVAALDARDEYTAGHSAAVDVYSRDIALRMGLDHDGQEAAYVSGLVHDIGKIGLPAGLLEKAGPLTLEERRLMQEHSVIGERILANVVTYPRIAEFVRHHHERIDGNGYPDRLEGDAIPLIARVIAVADAYNAMTSNRPYRDAMPTRVARLRLAQAVETQFDTSVVAAFEAILASSSEDYRRGIGFAFGEHRPRAKKYSSNAIAVAAK